MTDEAPSSLKGRFLQFPICLLAAGASDTEKTDLTLAEATRCLGHSIIEKDGPPEDPPADYDGYYSKYDDSCAIWAATKGRFDFSWPCPKSFGKHMNNATQFIDKFKSIHGKSPFVRCPESIWLNYEAGQMSFREFGVIVAVFSIIGDKQYAGLYRNDVRRRALGYHKGILDNASGDLLDGANEILHGRSDKEKLLSLEQIKYTLDRLEERNVFHRYQVGWNRIWASRSLSQIDLAKIAAQKRFKRHVSELPTKRAAAKAMENSEFDRLKAGYQAGTTPMR